MAQIVIDIDDKTYKAFMELISINLGRSNYKGIIGKCLDAIKHGTPLPKGHGRLIDIDKLIDSKCNECGHLRGVSCTIPCYEVRRMLGTPTIIEADKEEE